jgi:hypothetical protein
MIRTRLLVSMAGLFAACAAQPSADLAVERQALLELHERILSSHLTDDVDAWLAIEADSVLVGSRGEVVYTIKNERADMRRRYLAAAEFSVYRDLQPPIVHLSDDGSLGWVMAQVEVVGTMGQAPDTAAVHDVWAWVELYQRRPEGWRLVGNVSTPRSE